MRRYLLALLTVVVPLAAASSAHAEIAWQTPENGAFGRGTQPLAWQCPSGSGFQQVQFSRSNAVNDRGELADPVPDERGATNGPFQGFPFDISPGLCGSYGVSQEFTPYRANAYGGGWFFAQVLGPDHPDSAQRERSSVRRAFQSFVRPRDLMLSGGPAKRSLLVATDDGPASFEARLVQGTSCATRALRCEQRRLLIKAVPMRLGAKGWEYPEAETGAYVDGGPGGNFIPCADDPAGVRGRVVLDRTYGSDSTPEETFSLDLPRGQVLALCGYLMEGKPGDPAPAFIASGGATFSTPATFERRNLRWRTYERVSGKQRGYYPQFDCRTRINEVPLRCSGRNISRVFSSMFGGRSSLEVRRGGRWVKLPNVHAGNAYCGKGGAAPCKGDLVRFRYVAGKASRWNPGQLFDYASGVSKAVRVR